MYARRLLRPTLGLAMLGLAVTPAGEDRTPPTLSPGSAEAEPGDSTIPCVQVASSAKDGDNDIVLKASPSDGNGLAEDDLWNSKAAGSAYADNDVETS